MQGEANCEHFCWGVFGPSQVSGCKWETILLIFKNCFQTCIIRHLFPGLNDAFSWFHYFYIILIIKGKFSIKEHAASVLFVGLLFCYVRRLLLWGCHTREVTCCSQVDNPSSAQPSNHTCQSAGYVSKTILQPLARLLASWIPQCNLHHYHVKWNIYSAKSCPDSDAQNWEKY